jgi:hypothetical protein
MTRAQVFTEAGSGNPQLRTFSIPLNVYTLNGLHSLCSLRSPKAIRK